MADPATVDVPWIVSVDDLVIGAPYAARADGGVGAIFVHRGTATGFEDVPAWTLGAGDNFGATMALAGDVDGDGKEDLAVSALNGDGPDASLSGNVVVFKGGSSGKVLARLAGEMALDKFGSSITGRCDLDDDGKPDLVVGATHHSHAPDLWLGGAYYVYFGPTLARAGRIELPATPTFGILGFSSACGDLNGDGVDDLAVSAIWTHAVIWHESNVLVYYGEPGFAPATGAPGAPFPRTLPPIPRAASPASTITRRSYRKASFSARVRPARSRHFETPTLLPPFAGLTKQG